MNDETENGYIQKKPGKPGLMEVPTRFELV